MKTIIDILYLEEYKLLLLLNNGQEKVLNLESAIENPEFEALKEKKTFSKFVMTNGMLAWSNGKGLHHDHLISLLESTEMLLAA
ncbi:MAG: DUF2442 domain-containing protein [Opitutaceae bacterium]|nr:DUF2442 domain-containing protein [Cytophagales bacterium]